MFVIAALKQLVTGHSTDKLDSYYEENGPASITMLCPVGVPNLSE
jgi:hypothetical protein